MSDSKTFIITLVRHGETLSNRENIMQGQKDTQLSDLGHTQAQLVGERLKGELFTHMFSSDLARAADTAKAIVAANTRTTCCLVLKKELRERCFGFLEGKPLSEFQRVVKELNVPSQDYTPEGGETVEQVTKRAREFFNQLCKSIADPSINQTNPSDLKLSRSKISMDSAQSSLASTIGENSVDGESLSSQNSSVAGNGEQSHHNTNQKSSSKPTLPLSVDVNTEGSTTVSGDRDHVLVVSHGLWLREFRSVLLGHYKGEKLQSDVKNEAHKISPNTGVSRFNVEVSYGKKIHIRCTDILLLNDTSHLQTEGADLVSFAKFQGAL